MKTNGPYWPQFLPNLQGSDVAYALSYSEQDKKSALNMSNQYDPCQPVDAADIDAWHAETDVLVVGFGGAGACAALEAHYAGADVTILEVASGSGGTTALAGGMMYLGGGTPLQQACGFEDSVEDMEAYVTLASGPGGDRAKIHGYCHNSIDHYNWLVEQGVVFNPEFYGEKHTNTPQYQSLAFTGNEKGYLEAQAARPTPRGHKAKAFWEEGGSVLMATLTAAIDNTPVSVHYDSRVLALVCSAGAVVGVLCRQEGEIRALRARSGVVLCCGGFIMNEEMVSLYAPRLAQGMAIGSPNDTGSGILMGMGMGGAAINMDEGFISVVWYPSGEFCKGVFINQQGQRFFNEDCYHARGAHHCLNQTQSKVYMVVDSAIYTEPPLYADVSVVEVGETFEELEHDAGFAQGTLTHTMETYNRFAAQGEDPLFHKNPEFLQVLDKPPYALLDFSLDSGIYYPAFTFGGLDTTVDGEVLRASGKSIPGLYAAGRTTAGLPRSAEGYASGMSIGDVTYFGRRAGGAAAARGRTTPTSD